MTCFAACARRFVDSGSRPIKRFLRDSHIVQTTLHGHGLCKGEEAEAAGKGRNPSADVRPLSCKRGVPSRPCESEVLLPR